MIRKYLFCVVCMMLLLVPGCWDGPWTDKIDVPFRYQEQSNYCAVACIQMWSLYDGHSPQASQSQIYSYIGSNSDYDGYVVPENIEIGVSQFTNSQGFFMPEVMDNVGQDACIAACVAAIKDFKPAIMSFQAGRHAVLVVGSSWHYENGNRVANSICVHNPASSANKWHSAVEIKQNLFTVDRNIGAYWVVLGARKFQTDGWDGYMTFISEGGTYYGGPKDYNPYQNEY